MIILIQVFVLFFSVGLVFEEPVYEVSEAIATLGLQLVLHVCVIRSDFQKAPVVGTTNMTVFTINGTAKGIISTFCCCFLYVVILFFNCFYCYFVFVLFMVINLFCLIYLLLFMCCVVLKMRSCF